VTELLIQLTLRATGETASCRPADEKRTDFH